MRRMSSGWGNSTAPTSHLCVTVFLAVTHLSKHSAYKSCINHGAPAACTPFPITVKGK